MRIDKLNEETNYNDMGYVQILAKAILLDKVTINSDGRITVKAFKENE